MLKYMSSVKNKTEGEPKKKMVPVPPANVKKEDAVGEASDVGADEKIVKDVLPLHVSSSFLRKSSKTLLLEVTPKQQKSMGIAPSTNGAIGRISVPKSQQKGRDMGLEIKGRKFSLVLDPTSTIMSVKVKGQGGDNCRLECQWVTHHRASVSLDDGQDDGEDDSAMASKISDGNFWDVDEDYDDDLGGPKKEKKTTKGAKAKLAAAKKKKAAAKVKAKAKAKFKAKVKQK